MKRFILLLALLIFVPVTQAAEITFKGKSVSAFTIFAEDATGCITTNTTIVAFKFLDLTTDEIKAGIIVDLFQVDSCISYPIGTVIRDISDIVKVRRSVLQVDKELQFATLQATIRIFDKTQNEFVPLVIDLAWNGEGRKRRFRTRDKETTENGITIFYSNRVLRFATLSGSIYLAEDPTNLMQIPLENVVISSTTSGRVVRR